METESLSQAERLVHLVVGRWKAEIEAARSGSSEPLRKLDELALEWQRDFTNSKGDERIIYREVIESKTEEIRSRSVEEAVAFQSIAIGLSVPTAKFLDEWILGRSDTAKTIDMKRRDLMRFSAKFKYTNDVSKKEIQIWVRELQNDEKLHPNTVRRVLSACRVYWNYLGALDVIDETVDPFAGVLPAKVVKTKASIEEKRKAFSPSEVVGLLLQAIDREDLSLAHLIWLAMWSGCRIEELCALKVSEVRPNSFIVIDAKTGAGNREVPVHSLLQPVLHFLSENSSDSYVLSDLTLNKYGDRSNAIGKRFGRLKLSVGFGKAHVFHSIRKTVATLLQNADVPEPTSADIVGHEKKTMTYGLYSGGANLITKLKAIELIKYPVDEVPYLLLQKQ